MSDALLISVRLHEGWYHGSGSTPSPARMFQALIAGAGISGPLDDAMLKSLTWLEWQDPPIVASPHTTKGQPVVNYVPNNDLDAKQGDHRKIGEIRTKKVIAPLVFDPEVPFLFSWKLKGDYDIGLAKRVLALAGRVYQLGRTVDMAWAWGEILSWDELHDRLSSYPGIVRHPSTASGDVDCPTPGSLDSLRRRYAAAAERFDRTADERGQTFRRQPKPKWKKVSYEGTATQLMLELRRSDDSGFAPWPLERTVELVETLRDRAAQRLRDALKDRTAEVNRVLIGRASDGENDGQPSARVRIVPLPSIGSRHADMQMRRIVLEVPSECPIRADDIGWAVSGLQFAHPVLREMVDVTVSSDRSQLRFFGVGKPARTWRSITPVVFPEASRRRIDPARVEIDDNEKKGAREKYGEQNLASTAVAQALRHAGVRSRVNSIRVQREPFDLYGARAEPFAEGTRFSKHTMWHLEIDFESLVSGPLLIGNGRFLGLGLMRPVTPTVGVYAFSIESGLNPNPDPMRLARALRRAVMARTRDVLRTSRIPTYFSGHHEDGAPARREEEAHLAFVFDTFNRQLLVVTPEHLDRRNNFRDIENLATLEFAIHDLRELRAGVDGKLQLRAVFVDVACQRLFQTSHVWESVTPYDVNRHSRKSTAEAVLKNDVLAECERRGLSYPEVTIIDWNAVPGAGLQGRLRLQFRDAIQGLLILGRSRHVGGGVFAPLDQAAVQAS